MVFGFFCKLSDVSGSGIEALYRALSSISGNSCRRAFSGVMLIHYAAFSKIQVDTVYF
jgi:hypothetical protein